MNIAIVNCQRVIPVPISKIRFAARKALRKLQREYDPELSIVFVGPQRMRRMNKKYLGHDYVTDVITFDYADMSFPNVFIGNPGMRKRAGPPIKAFGGDRHFFHGEIVVCPQAAARNAKCYGNSVDQELVLYVVHGLLHLAGYDDKTAEDKRRMRKKERELM